MNLKFRSNPIAWAFVTWSALLIAEFIFVYLACSGHLVFTLDDPYIHLSVADQILRGGYGVNAGSYSSPSSSIIWPYILAVTEALHLGAYGPFLVNVASVGGALYIFLTVLRNTGILNNENGYFFPRAAASASVFVISGIGLPFLGMEHGLQLLSVIATFSGLVRAAEGKTLGGWYLLSLVMVPLVRFEGFAFALSALVALTLLGYRKFSLHAFLCIVICVGIYALRMHMLGLPFLPSSVLLKSYATSLGTNFQNALHSKPGLMLICVVPFMAFTTWKMRMRRPVFIVSCATIFPIIAHLMFGHYGWFYRYEVYIVSLAALGCIWIYSMKIRNAEGRITLDPAQKMVISAVLFLPAFYYVIPAIRTPAASRGIYDQQYQMGIFARDIYQRPVAVNDLGLVSWKNKNFVLDLYGLGSETVRKEKMRHHYGPAEVSSLTNRRRVGLAMIYQTWFEQRIPKDWTRIAILHTPRVSSASPNVSFYLTPNGNSSQILKDLVAFKRVLPADDRLIILAQNHSGTP